MPSWKITLEYDGSNYHGWQEQTNAKAVASEIRKAAEEFFGAPVELQGSGRTDSGVHALAQAAHLRVDAGPLKPAEVLKGLNEKLPTSIVVLDVEETHDRFHARHDAVTRSYVYRISTRRTAFEKKYVWWIREKLDLAKMQLAAQKLIGRHDFSAFAQVDPTKPDNSTIVVVNEAGVVQEENLILFRIEASHFLWKMVRRLAGALVKIGNGELKLSEFEQFLEGEADPRIATWTAPASGLFLERVSYEAAPAVEQPEEEAETEPKPARVKRAPAAREERPAYAADQPVRRAPRTAFGDGPPRRDDGGTGRPGRTYGGKPPGDDRPARGAGSRSYGAKSFGDDRAPRRAGPGRDDSGPARRPYGDSRPPRRDDGPAPRSYGAKPYGAKSSGSKPFGGKSFGDDRPARRTGPARDDTGGRSYGAKSFSDDRPPRRTGPARDDARPPRREDGPAPRSFGAKPFGAKPYGGKSYGDDRPPRPSRFDDRPPARGASRGSDERSPARPPRRADGDRGGARGDGPSRPRTPFGDSRSERAPRREGPRDDRDQRPARGPRGFDGPPAGRPKGPGGPKSFGGPKKFAGPKKSFGGPKRGGKPKRG